ncbi:MBL fold metallo-hydrolase [Desulfococcaceae bacterium HSG9]|nr:MBL fold metallo-hydrolase [Desulfococcaceae bacterium HSG9]
MNTTNSDINITILGSGTCVPSLKRTSCSVLIETSGKKLLFDSGAGVMRRLLETGTTIFDIDFIFYSHFHPDHTGELVPFLFATKYPAEKQRLTPLTITAGKGFKKFYDSLKTVYGNWIELEEGSLNISELDNKAADRRAYKAFTVLSTPVAHNPESIAYRIDSLQGKSVVYSGDTDFSTNLITLAQDADLLICESAFPDQHKIPGHLTPSLAGSIAKQANARKLVLTHLYPECDLTDIRAQCRQEYDGPLIIAEDLMKIEIN